MMQIPVAAMAHDQKNHVAPYFHHLDLINAICPLTAPLASYDADVNDVT